MTDSQLDTLLELHPKPRVGQLVKLRKRGRVGGKIGEVITVRKARDVLRLKTDVTATMLGHRLKAQFGSRWIDVYYEADIMVGDVLITVSTPDVDSILEND